MILAKKLTWTQQKPRDGTPLSNNIWTNILHKKSLHPGNPSHKLQAQPHKPKFWLMDIWHIIRQKRLRQT